MPYIRVINEDEAEGELFDVYDDIQRRRGRVANVLRIQSLRPRGLKRHLEMYMDTVFGNGPLTRRQREMVAVAVSAANGCAYCVTHHGEALHQGALGLTRTPGEGRAEAVEALRAAGFDDEAVLHATEVTSYFNYVNRLVAGLGVELEESDDRDYD